MFHFFLMGSALRIADRDNPREEVIVGEIVDTFFSAGRNKGARAEDLETNVKFDDPKRIVRSIFKLLVSTHTTPLTPDQKQQLKKHILTLRQDENIVEKLDSSAFTAFMKGSP